MIRFDNRSASYTPADMAAGTTGLLDALGPGSAHIAGASLGGMIAQTMAIEHPARVRSLTSIMSTTGARGVGLPDLPAIAGLGAPPADRAGFIDWRVRALRVTGSPGFEFDEAAVAELARSFDRDGDRLAMVRQTVAVLASGDRTARLRSLRVSALVVHGADDRMCHVSGGRTTAAAIPDAELVIFDGMGHSLPQQLWPKFADLIAGLIQRAETAQAQA